MDRRTAVAAAMVATATAITTGLSVPASADGRARSTAARSYDLGQTARLGHFDVTVSGVRVDRGYADGFFTGVEATVCVTRMPRGQKTMRVSWDPWSVTTTQGAQGQQGWEGDGPWAEEQYPYERRLAKGDCATGVVPVIINNTGTIVTIGYQNSFGETATWKLR